METIKLYLNLINNLYSIIAIVDNYVTIIGSLTRSQIEAGECQEEIKSRVALACRNTKMCYVIRYYIKKKIVYLWGVCQYNLFLLS